MSSIKQDSRDGYRDMQEYIWSLEDEHLRELLEVAIQGSGAFRHFKDVLYRYSEAQENWFRFRNEREKQRMIDWLASQGIEPEFESTAWVNGKHNWSAVCDE